MSSAEDRLQSLPGGRCLHCDQDCTLESDALQCDLCQNWVHSKCEGISSELYKQLNDVCSGIINVSYYCELNCCNNRIKQLVADWKLSQSASPVDVEEVNKSVQSLSSRYDSLTQSVKELSTKIESLLTRNENLQMEVNSISEPTATPNQPDTVPFVSMSSTGTTLTILDELADRERRRKNLIVYNLAESSESQSDQPKLQELCSSVFKKDITLTKTVRLGRKNGSKPRPLLACFDDVSIRNRILSVSGKLRKFDQYKNTYIAPDRTKLERQKHVKLVEELKRRRSDGEQNLIIRNGSIIVVTRHPSAAADSSQHS